MSAEEKKQEQERKELQSYIDNVAKIDQELTDNTLDIEKYASDKGKSLYLFFQKLYKPFSNRTKVDDPMKLFSFDIGAVDDPFPIKDPFIDITNKYKSAKINGKKYILELIWDVILKNSRDVEKALKRNKSNDSVDSDNSDSDAGKLTREEILNFRSAWYKIGVEQGGDFKEKDNRFEQKVYLYKFCVLVGPDMINMKGIKDIDIVEVYNKTNEDSKMIDVFTFQKESGCVIM